MERRPEQREMACGHFFFNPSRITIALFAVMGLSDVSLS
jgi:hypothetical protein